MNKSMLEIYQRQYPALYSAIVNLRDGIVRFMNSDAGQLYRAEFLQTDFKSYDDMAKFVSDAMDAQNWLHEGTDERTFIAAVSEARFQLEGKR